MKYFLLRKITILNLLYSTAVFAAETKHTMHLSSSCNTAPIVLRKNVSSTPLNTLYPLHNAAHCGDLHDVQLLLEKKAGINTSNHLGETILHSVVSSQKIQDQVRKAFIKKLLSQKADINSCAIHHGTPLHYVITRADHNMARFLLKHKANVNAPNRNKETPLHFAINEHGSNKKIINEFIKLLINYKADPTITMPCACCEWDCDDEFTPLQLACQNGAWQETLSLLQQHSKTSFKEKL